MRTFTMAGIPLLLDSNMGLLWSFEFDIRYTSSG